MDLQTRAFTFEPPGILYKNIEAQKGSKVMNILIIHVFYTKVVYKKARATDAKKKRKFRAPTLQN